MKIKLPAYTLLLVLLLINLNSYSQNPGWSWANSSGSKTMEMLSSIALDDSSSVYATGFFMDTVDFDPGPGIFNLVSNGNEDIYIVKYSSAGNFIWAKAFGGSGYDWGFSIKIDHQQNILVTGFFSDSVDFDPNAGNHFLNSAGFNDIFVLKLDRDGNYIWSVNMGGIASDAGNSIAVDDSDNVYTTGTYFATADFDPDSTSTYNLSTNGELEIFISKLDSSGKFVWAKSVGSTDDEQGYSIAVDPWGYVLVTGYFEKTVDFDPGVDTFALTSGSLPDGFILKLDRNGNFDWAKSFTGIADNDGMSVATDKSGNVYSTGYFIGTVDFNPDSIDSYNITSAGQYDAYVSKLDSAGNFVWMEQFGSPEDEQGINLVLDDSANIYFAGIGYNVFGAFDFFIEKLDSSGNQIWNDGGAGNNRDQVNSLAIDRMGNIYAGGYFYSKVLILSSNLLYNADSLSLNADIFVGRLGNFTTGIQKLDDKNNVLIYPNPNSGVIKIKLPYQSKEINVSMYDLSGKLIYLKDFENLKEIEITKHNLSPGIYFLKIKAEDFIETEKIIIENYKN